ncbi:hypothetical protein LRS06_22455 [Hymenobacter sp. J193]|uniref:hypothetical protein n=1 Tax=Hymenobacter sp. J193 TaxID=2898429 RepID=UPI0021516406|nr:hypothetical protein [Hymenobacter sp. J193]MCR5890493.1 hypothetical protein [Hymenobacter sp. J193]
MMSAPRQPGNQRLTGFYVGLTFLLMVLAGGEYYFLTHPDLVAGATSAAGPKAGLGTSITTRLLGGLGSFYRRYGLLVRGAVLVGGGCWPCC